MGGRGLNASLPRCFYIYNSIGTGDEKYKLIITQSGHVGIGETNPTVPLDIAGWNASFPLGSNQTGPYIGTDSNNKQWFGFPDTGQTEFRVMHSSSAAGNDNISIRAAGTIWSKRRFLVHSDRRIKTEIEDVNNTEALDIVNKIPCRKYYYSDPERQMSLNKTIGFIAQEVKEHLPQAITIGTDMVFDEKLCIENPIWNGNILTIEGLVFTDNHTGKCRFEVRDGESEIGETIILTVNDDKKTFTFEKPWKQLILLTKEVNDFHALDKAKIFALHHAALQEVDRQLQAEKAKTATLEAENTDLRADIELIKEHLGISTEVG